MSALPPVQYQLEYPYTRTTGPIVGAFLTGLRDGKLLGIRCRGRVLCPPLEYDPETGETLAADFVEVGPGGTIVTWTWIAEPTRKHPFAEPFAFALIRPDGADTAICHAVKASGPGALAAGGRVRAQYREERKGAITDLYFAPEAEAENRYVPPGKGAVEMTEHLISLEFSEPLAPHRERFARGLLDGTDQPLGQQDIRTVPIAEFRSGIRLRAVWKPKGERSVLDVDNRWGGTGSVIERWEPTGEPDVPFEKIMEHNW